MSWGDELAALTIDRGPALVGYAYLLTGDLESARDLVQEALVRTYGRPRSASVEWVEAYVRRVILNVYLDGYRRDGAWRRVRHLLVARDDGPTDDGPTTRTAEQVDVQAALRELPPRERACVVLRFYDDLTVPALAARLGISEGAAKRYLSDGVRRLHGALGPIAEDEVADVQLITRSPR